MGKSITNWGKSPLKKGKIMYKHSETLTFEQLNKLPLSPNFMREEEVNIAKGVINGMKYGFTEGFRNKRKTDCLKRYLRTDKHNLSKKEVAHIRSEINYYKSIAE